MFLHFPLTALVDSRGESRDYARALSIRLQRLGTRPSVSPMAILRADLPASSEPQVSKRSATSWVAQGLGFSASVHAAHARLAHGAAPVQADKGTNLAAPSPATVQLCSCPADLPSSSYTPPHVRRWMARGRLVLSGRLADVCAELERLAAQEALCSGMA
ncbi:hypothetical protein [Brachymonas sp. M4Q-1]|uniref:hypothetical protein n=1 Tax=Brachymonas sp. M4Q-1 TaxID=3416906 RepID=UPI003CE78B9E